jgi:hypothetical protein
MKTKCLFRSLLFAAFTGTALGNIIQTNFGGDWNVLTLGPIGQTFTADEQHLSSIGVDFSSTSGGYITYSLLAGAGANGPIIATSTAYDLPGVSGFANASFAGVDLTVGDVYTVILTAPNNQWLVDWNQVNLPGAVDYTGGVAIFQGKPLPIADLAFEVLSVPDSNCQWLLLIFPAIFLARVMKDRIATEPISVPSSRGAA